MTSGPPGAENLFTKTVLFTAFVVLLPRLELAICISSGAKLLKPVRFVDIPKFPVRKALIAVIPLPVPKEYNP